VAVGQGEIGVVGGHRQVAGQHQGQAEAGGGTADRGHYGFAHAAHLQGGGMHGGDGLFEKGLAFCWGQGQLAVEPLEVAAGHEVLAAAQDHGADGFVVLGPGGGGAQVLDHGQVEGVEGLGAVQGQGQDPVLQVGKHGAHGLSPLGGGFYGFIVLSFRGTGNPVPAGGRK